MAALAQPSEAQTSESTLVRRHSKPQQLGIYLPSLPPDAVVWLSQNLPLIMMAIVLRILNPNIVSYDGQRRECWRSAGALVATMSVRSCLNLFPVFVW